MTYLNPRVGSAALQGAAEQAQRNIQRMADLQERIGELVGEASGADGKITARCTASAVPADLRIDPRAMRLGSEELAATITDVIQRASADLRLKMQAVLTGGAGGDSLQDQVAALREQADAAVALFNQLGQEAQTEMAGAGRRLNDAVNDLSRSRNRG